ncbi:hypothetical protein [Bradyrhizobium septentrionale]|uniref:Uncharacterized protein n=1 Tax=Bradyrhizobium septentrionale TaxID=1404411 RepID=A0A973W2F5_9BRAD|nr:hypothetical protein [Bradyrhizobium septentrionale]UGY14727.1 hypothetical protein HAP48_0040310 [Bradyrhizobium septentrionale]UGY23302.1 hypothetical protein HU675_0035905 [Bradyrhizobium septentrionale]
MLWTATNLYIQIVAGFIGAHLVAAVVRDHAFGFWGHSAAGLIASALGGYFLQSYAATVVMGNGALNELRPADNFFLQAATGATLGGMGMLAIGMLMHRPKSD